MSELVNSALESLRKIKLEMKTKEYLKTDMWCHFGTAIVRGPDQGIFKVYISRPYLEMCKGRKKGDPKRIFGTRRET